MHSHAWNGTYPTVTTAGATILVDPRGGCHPIFKYVAETGLVLPVLRENFVLNYTQYLPCCNALGIERCV